MDVVRAAAASELQQGRAQWVASLPQSQAQTLEQVWASAQAHVDTERRKVTDEVDAMLNATGQASEKMAECNKRHAAHHGLTTS